MMGHTKGRGLGRGKDNSNMVLFKPGHSIESCADDAFFIEKLCCHKGMIEESLWMCSIWQRI